MEKIIDWTDHAKQDLKSIYEFNTKLISEAYSYELVLNILDKVEQLKKTVLGSTRYISKLQPELPFQKLVYHHYIVIFRTEKDRILINRVFDTRQDPAKLNL